MRTLPILLSLALCCCKSSPPTVVVAKVDTLATGRVVTSYRPLLPAELSGFRGEHDALFRAIGYTPRRNARVSFKKARIEIVQGNKQTSSRGGVVATDSAVVTAGKKQRVETVNKDVAGDYTETAEDSGSGLSFRLPVGGWIAIAALVLIFIYFVIKNPFRK